MILLVYGIILVIGAASGGKNIYRPLQGLNSLTGPALADHQPLPFKTIKNLDDLDAALANAGVSNDFTYISSAGGAFLEWLEGRDLPGIEALKD